MKDDKEKRRAAAAVLGSARTPRKAEAARGNGALADVKVVLMGGAGGPVVLESKGALIEWLIEHQPTLARRIQPRWGLDRINEELIKVGLHAGIRRGRK